MLALAHHIERQIEDGKAVDKVIAGRLGCEERPDAPGMVAPALRSAST